MKIKENLFAIAAFALSLFPEGATDGQRMAKKDKKNYSVFSIEYHNRYEHGTFMLFGFSRKENRPLLLNETNNDLTAHQWSRDYECDMPILDAYTPCTCC